MMLRTIICFVLSLHLGIFAQKLPEIDAEQTHGILEQMMQAHASHHELTLELTKKAFLEYLSQLDPIKTYFLADEVSSYTNPSEEFLTESCEQIKKANFESFETLHALFVEKIQRRNDLEKTLETEPLEVTASHEEFKEIEWVNTQEELITRLAKIALLQQQSAANLDDAEKHKVLQKIAKRRVSREEEIRGKDPKETQKWTYTAVLKSFAGSMDTHTAYFTPGEAAQFLIQVQQRLFGIGAQLRDDLDGFSIVKIIEKSPASLENKLILNDKIIAVDQEPVIGMDITEAVELIRGPIGTEVVLTILRETSEGPTRLEISLKRDEIVLHETRLESSLEPFADGVIVHLTLHSFYQDPYSASASDIAKKVYEISKDHKIKGLLLDLRTNTGGVLPQAVAVSGLFVTKGIIVSVKNNQEKVEHLRKTENRTLYDGPLVILTSKMSASAAEIVAQTLQDYGRAIVCGDQATFGKGTFQTFTLDGNSLDRINPKGEFKVTRGRYYTVSGKSPQLTGVTPDVLVPGVLNDLDIGEKFAKYPLDTDHIGENFHDDLSDIPLTEREQMHWLYRYNLQTKLTTFTKHLPKLKENSSLRLSTDPLYTKLLEQDFSNKTAQDTDAIYLGDYQYKEALNVLKDLIVLCSKG